MPVFKKFGVKHITNLPNQFLQNPDISLAAKGLLSYMLSLPDDWKFTIEGLAKQTGASSEKVIKLLKELQSFGYHIKEHKCEGGRFKEWVYYIFAEPRQDIIDGTFNSELLDSRNPESGNIGYKQCNNINIIKNNFQTISSPTENRKKKEVNNVSNIDRKLTKKQQKELEEQELNNKLKETLDKYTAHYSEDVKDLLNDYLEIRKQKGLTPTQLMIILEDFQKECGNNEDYQIVALRKAIASGWNQIVFIDSFRGSPKTSYSSVRRVDNTATHDVGNRKITDEEFYFLDFENQKEYLSRVPIADMTVKQREFFEKYCLARDEDGNLIKF